MTIWQACQGARQQLIKLLNTWTLVFPDEMLAVIRQRLALQQTKPKPFPMPFTPTVPLPSPTGPGPLHLQGQIPGSVPLVSQAWPLMSANGHANPGQAASLRPSYPHAGMQSLSASHHQQQPAQIPQQQLYMSGFQSSQQLSSAGHTSAPPTIQPEPAALAANDVSSTDAPATANILQILLQAGMLSMPSNDPSMGMQQGQPSNADVGLGSLSPKAIKVSHR